MLRSHSLKCCFSIVYGRDVVSWWPVPVGYVNDCVFCLRRHSRLSIWGTTSKKLQRVTEVLVDISEARTSLTRICLDVGRAVLGREASIIRWVHKAKDSSKTLNFKLGDNGQRISSLALTGNIEKDLVYLLIRDRMFEGNVFFEICN